MNNFERIKKSKIAKLFNHKANASLKFLKTLNCFWPGNIVALFFFNQTISSFHSLQQLISND